MHKNSLHLTTASEKRHNSKQQSLYCDMYKPCQCKGLTAHWSVHEDIIMVKQFLLQSGARNWTNMTKLVPGKSYNAIRNRFLRILQFLKKDQTYSKSQTDLQKCKIFIERLEQKLKLRNQECKMKLAELEKYQQNKRKMIIQLQIIKQKIKQDEISYQQIVDILTKHKQVNDRMKEQYNTKINGNLKQSKNKGNEQINGQKKKKLQNQQKIQIQQQNSQNQYSINSQNVDTGRKQHIKYHYNIQQSLYLPQNKNQNLINQNQYGKQKNKIQPDLQFDQDRDQNKGSNQQLNQYQLVPLNMFENQQNFKEQQEQQSLDEEIYKNVRKINKINNTNRIKYWNQEQKIWKQFIYKNQQQKQVKIEDNCNAIINYGLEEDERSSIFYQQSKIQDKLQNNRLNYKKAKDVNKIYNLKIQDNNQRSTCEDQHKQQIIKPYNKNSFQEKENKRVNENINVGKNPEIVRKQNVRAYQNENQPDKKNLFKQEVNKVLRVLLLKEKINQALMKQNQIKNQEQLQNQQQTTKLEKINVKTCKSSEQNIKNLQSFKTYHKKLKQQLSNKSRLKQKEPQKILSSMPSYEEFSQKYHQELEKTKSNVVGQKLKKKKNLTIDSE